jgi:Ca-activated chloride channel family protein
MLRGRGTSRVAGYIGVSGSSDRLAEVSGNRAASPSAMQEVEVSSSSGRHRRYQGRSRHLVRWAAAVTVGALALAGCGVGLALGRHTDATCSDGVRTLRVAVTPELAGIVTKVARTVDTGRGGACTKTRVTATSSSEVAASLRKTGQSSRVAPDVWIPDSSAWLRRSSVGSLHLPTPYQSVARSPIVVAVARQTGAALGWNSRTVDLSPLLDGDATGRPADLYLPDPHGSAAAAGALLSLQATAALRADGRAALAAALLGHVGSAEGDQSGQQFTVLAGGRPEAVPTSEQQVWAYDRAAAAAKQVVASYPSLHASSLDYPWVVLARARQAQEDAVRLLAAVIGHHGRELLLAAGFRDRNGIGGPVLTSELGVDRAIPAGPAPRGDDVDRVLRSLDVLRQGSRMLAVIDISGSMGEQVPGAGGATKLDLTKKAAVRGLGVYPDDTEIGLWAFSTHLTPSTDYRQLVPIGPIGARSGAMTGRQQLAGALAALQHVPGGSTGLYDTALAATRRVRAQWEPGRVNSVVLLTDGRNDDDQGIGLAELLTLLRAENDPQRPVPLITIAYGAQSPVGALRAMSAATGGATYVAKDPRQVRQVFLEAIQQRACRPDCA